MPVPGDLPAAAPATSYDALEGTPVRADPVVPWNSLVSGEELFHREIESGYALAVAWRLTEFCNNLGFRMAGSEANRQSAAFFRALNIR